MQLSESLALKAVSLLLALILWITILGFKREEVRKNVPFEPMLAPGMMITNKIPSSIQFTFVGPRVLLKDMEKKIQPIRPDFRRSRESTIPIAIVEDLIGELPQGVRVTSFYPPNVLVRLEDIIETEVSVKASLRGFPPPGFEISSVKITPPKISVSGPRSLIQTLEIVGTEPMEIEGLRGTREAVLSIEVDTSLGFQISKDKVVKVRVTARSMKGQGEIK